MSAQCRGSQTRYRLEIIECIVKREVYLQLHRFRLAFHSSLRTFCTTACGYIVYCTLLVCPVPGIAVTCQRAPLVSVARFFGLSRSESEVQVK